MSTEGFLERFFGDGNITLDSIPAELLADLEPSLRALRDGLQSPAFLPRTGAGGLRWYGLCRDANNLAELIELVQAGVGPTWSGFRGEAARLAQGDPIDEAVQQLTDGHCLIVEVLPDASLGATKDAQTRARESVREALMRIVRLMEQRPRSVLDLKRPLRRVLADLDHAVAEGDYASAERLLDEFEALPTVTPTNYLFVRIRVLTRLGRHGEALELPQLSHVLESRPPRTVRLHLLEAAFEAVLRELDPRDRQAVEDAAARVGPTIVAVLDHAPAPAMPAHAWALAFASFLADRADALGHYLAWLDEHGEDVSTWRAELAPESGGETPEVPESASWPQRADAAQDEQAIRRLVGEALVEGTVEAAAATCAAVDERSPSLVNDPLMGSAIATLRGLVDSIGDRPPGSWVEWLEECSREDLWPAARDAAEIGREDWRLTQAEAATLAEKFRSLEPVAAENARSGLGLLIESADSIRDTTEGGELLLACLELLALTGGTSHDERQAVLGWTSELLESGMQENRYRGLLDCLDLIWEASGSPGVLPWMADLLQVLVDQPCPSDQRRTDLFWRTVGDASGWLRGMDSIVLAQLRGVAELLGMPIDGPPLEPTDDEPEDPLHALDGLILAIHSLMQSSARSATQVVRRSAPSCDVRLNEDKVATSELEALAAGADVFTLVTAACKHAASDAVKSSRPAGKPLLEVHSKGAGAILRALRDWARSAKRHAA